MAVKLNFDLILESSQKDSVKVLIDNNEFDLVDNIPLPMQKVFNIDSHTSAEQLCILKISNLHEGARIKIQSLCINSVNVPSTEMQDFFNLETKGNRYTKDHLIELIYEICFNGELNLALKRNLSKLFWAPWYSSDRRNDFVFDNRLLSSFNLPDGQRPSYIDETIDEKVYENKPHYPINEKQIYELGCFGCSITFGTGLDYNDTWPSLLNPNHINLSLPALGIDGIFLNLNNALKKFKWKKTIIVLPNWERKIFRFQLPSGEFCRVPVVVSNMEWAHSRLKHWAWQTFNRQLTRDYLEKWKKQYQKNTMFIMSDNIIEYNKRFLNKIVQLCEKHQGEYYISSWDEEVYEYINKELPKNNLLPYFEKIDIANDDKHPGPNSHKIWVEKIDN